MNRRGFLGALAGFLASPIIEPSKKYFFFGGIMRPAERRLISLKRGDSLEDAIKIIADGGLILLGEGVYTVSGRTYRSEKKVTIVGSPERFIWPLGHPHLLWQKYVNGGRVFPSLGKVMPLSTIVVHEEMNVT